MVNKSSKSQTLCGLLVAALMVGTPVMAAAGEYTKQEPLQENPLKKLKDAFPKLQENAAKKIQEALPQLLLLYKFEVPVYLQNVHPDVDKAETVCVVGKMKNPPFQPPQTAVDIFPQLDVDHAGIGITKIMMNSGGYGGNISVLIPKTQAQGDPALFDVYVCLLVFYVDGTEIIPGDTEMATKEGIDPDVVKSKAGPFSSLVYGYIP